jgi:hypothetical protein
MTEDEQGEIRFRIKPECREELLRRIEHPVWWERILDWIGLGYKF